LQDFFDDENKTTTKIFPGILIFFVEQIVTLQKHLPMSMKTIIYLSIITCFCCLSLPLYALSAYTVTSVPNVRLKNANDYVTNPDGIISQTAKEAINEKIAAVENITTAEIAVILLSSIGNEDIDDFGTRLFTQWGIGKKNDNGLLFLLVYDKKEMIFRTGYGLEGVLPDVVLSRVIRNDILPLLRRGDFDGGVVAGITKVCDYIQNPETVREIMQQEENKPVHASGFFRVYLGISFIIAVCFFFYLFSKTGLKTTNHQKYLSLKKQNGVIIFCTVLFPVVMLLFILIYFLVLKRLRTKPIACDQCGNKMLRLTAIAPTFNAYLTPAQRTEETIGSIDYDVWHCNQCGNTNALPFNNQMSKYTICPYCQAKTYYLEKDRVINQATTLSKGKGERIYSCMNCKNTRSTLYDIPRIVLSQSYSNSRGGWGSSGGGGGSWGGGRTGGGGARGGW